MNNGLSAIDYWHQFTVQGKNPEENLLIEALKSEPTTLVSTIFERGCNLQCEHCFYQAERATAPDSDIHGLGPILQNLVAQLPQDGRGKLLHAGRILRSWHIEVLGQIHGSYPQVKLGLIDSGHYTSLLEPLTNSGLRFNWIDISIDGSKEVHNRQRNSPHAFDMVLAGLQHAREITAPKGRTSALFTITTINRSNIEQTASLALEHVDEFHLSPIHPRQGQEPLTTSIEQFTQAWQGIVRASHTHGSERVILRLYSGKELERLGEVTGKQKLLEALEQALVVEDTAMLFLNLEGVRIYFFPPSLWPQEEIIVDADGAYRTGYSGQYTLEELQKGRTDLLEDVRNYTLMQLDQTVEFGQIYQKCVDHWWNFLGKKKFQEEQGSLLRLKGGENNAKY